LRRTITAPTRETARGVADHVHDAIVEQCEYVTIAAGFILYLLLRNRSAP
jgi:hypothetical protein